MDLIFLDSPVTKLIYPGNKIQVSAGSLARPWTSLALRGRSRRLVVQGPQTLTVLLRMSNRSPSSRS